MKHIAAYLLAVLGGNPNPDEKAIKAILSAAGIEADPAHLQKLLSELKNKDLADIIAKGRTKLASVPAGGAGGSSTTTTAAETKKGGKEEKKEEKKRKEKGRKERRGRRRRRRYGIWSLRLKISLVLWSLTLFKT